MKYAKGQHIMIDNMEPIDAQTLINIQGTIPTAAVGFHHLPFCELERGAREFGALRHWVKMKSWDDLKYRPVVSFKKQRWRKLWSLLSRL